MIWLAHHDTLTEETILSERLPNSFHDFTIFFIADIHRRKVNEQTIRQVSTTIDAVFIGGDLIERGVSFDKMINNIRTLKTLQAPIYFVWGNNDYEKPPKKMRELLELEDVIILEDTIVTINRGSENVKIIGFNYYASHDFEPQIEWDVIDPSYTILLVHKPSTFYHLPLGKRVIFDLVLAGHTHGGQIRLFGFGLYQKGALDQIDHTTIFITEGYGYTALPFRLGTKSQCHLITLKHINNV